MVSNTNEVGIVSVQKVADPSASLISTVTSRQFGVIDQEGRFCPGSREDARHNSVRPHVL